MAPAMAPAMAPDVAPAPAPSDPFPTELSAAQLGEVWAAPTDDAALELLARCLQLPDEYEEEPRIAIWLDMLFKWLDFGKLNELTPVKALTYMRVMAMVHAHAVGAHPLRHACPFRGDASRAPSARRDSLAHRYRAAFLSPKLCHRPPLHAETNCSKEGAFQAFTDGLLNATKAMPLAERFSLAEVKLLTDHASSSYLSAVKLHQLVFTQEQTVRESYVELFLQTPAAPPATADAIDPNAIPPPAPVAAPASEAPAPAPEVPPPAEDAAAPADAPPTLDDEQLTAAIAATISAQVRVRVRVRVRTAAIAATISAQASPIQFNATVWLGSACHDLTWFSLAHLILACLCLCLCLALPCLALTLEDRIGPDSTRLDSTRLDSTRLDLT